MPTLLNRHTLIKRTYPHITCNLNGFLDKNWDFGNSVQKREARTGFKGST